MGVHPLRPPLLVEPVSNLITDNTKVQTIFDIHKYFPPLFNIKLLTIYTRGVLVSFIVTGGDPISFFLIYPPFTPGGSPYIYLPGGSPLPYPPHIDQNWGSKPPSIPNVTYGQKNFWKNFWENLVPQLISGVVDPTFLIR